MSFQIQASRASTGANLTPQMGIFGFIKDRIRDAAGFISDPLGSATDLFGGRGLPSSGPGASAPPAVPINIAQQAPPQAPRTPVTFNPPFGGEPGVGVTFGGTATAPQARRNGAAGTKLACPSGFHPNKTSYFTKAGFVQAGTKCVKNRRRNPLNPRAASRAISRLESAKRASKMINRIRIQDDTPTKTRTVTKCFRCGNSQGACKCQ